MRSIQSDEKECVRQIFHRDAPYYVIISSFLMIGHLELAIGTLISHASWVGLEKSVHKVRFFSHVSDLIMNVEHFTSIDRIDRIFVYECNQCFICNLSSFALCELS